MTAINIFETSFIKKIKSAETAEIIQPVHVGETDKQNELVFFIKPELLDVRENDKILNSLILIRDKFNEFNVTINGAAIVPGTTLEKYEIMNRHYGFINQLSRMASDMVDSETREHLFVMLDLEDQGDHRVIGGHEFLNTFDADVDTLSDIWFAQEALAIAAFHQRRPPHRSDALAHEHQLERDEI